jgi:hypothetical protein
MGQPHRGKRRLVGTRLPEDLMSRVLTYAEARRLSLSEAMADLAATALGEPLPSETLPRPKSPKQQELVRRGRCQQLRLRTDLLDVSRVDASIVRVAKAFTSRKHQTRGPTGDTCDIWTLEYTMIQGRDNSWVIDATEPHYGTEHTTC